MHTWPRGTSKIGELKRGYKKNEEAREKWQIKIPQGEEIRIMKQGTKKRSKKRQNYQNYKETGSKHPRA